MDSTPASARRFPAQGGYDPKAVVQGKHYRFTLLTDHILRMEYDPEGVFENRPSQVVLNRRFPVPEYRVTDDGRRLEIDTKNYHLAYYYADGAPFAPHTLQIDAKNNYTNYGHRFRYGERMYGDPPRHHNLYGAARTLDRSDGPVPLEYGLMSQAGHSWFDDTASALFHEDGSLVARRSGTIDCYYVCCQHDYLETLQDFFRLSGRMPMLPRWALGNWWSCYKAYSAEEYNALMTRFRQTDVPFTVAILDMDWHLTDIPAKYGKGWTGYTWNRELFPEPRAFLQGLHEMGMHTALNLHPADGVQGCEAAYPAFAAAMGMDPATDEPVVFDFTDPKFIDAYFDLLLRPHEDDGVDFWWIDWQQGRQSPMKGLDPLYLLNHYHYLDNCRGGKRGLILSRYSGLGAQRYPAGFSGDTTISWASLDFQAYFTATSVNAGFPWWSHDIGGFFRGTRDPELFVRWLQLGTFSQFLRLHSSKSIFTRKEPDSFGPTAQPIIESFLRLRHRLIPYLYSAIYRGHTQGVPTILPVYYLHPDKAAAYEQTREYFFGSELLVAPITSPADPDSRLGAVTAYLPEGLWTDIFTGKSYQGDKTVVFSRPLGQIPVLAKAGAIVPTAAYVPQNNDSGNPREMEIFVFPGASNRFTLFEDSGDGDGFEKGEAYFTEFTLDWEAKRFTLSGQGDHSLLPRDRGFRITFRGFEPFTPTGEAVQDVAFDPATHSITVTLAPWNGETVTLSLDGARREENKDVQDRVEAFLMGTAIPNVQRTALFNLLDEPDAFRIAQGIAAIAPPKAVSDGLLELLGD